MSGQNVRKVCTFEGCERIRHSSGLCHSHTMQRRRGRDLVSIQPRMARPPVCSFPECERKHAANGLCSAHRMQEWRGNSLAPIQRRYGNRHLP